MSSVKDSDRYEGTELCNVDDVTGEIGGLIQKYSGSLFPGGQTRDVLLGRWCKREQAKFFQYVRVDLFQLKGNWLEIARDAVLFRVCARVIRKIQANRTNKLGGVPSYAIVLADYKEEISQLEHSLAIAFHPHAKVREEAYPPSYDIQLIVEGLVSGDPIPGAQVWVNSIWVTSTWSDGLIDFLLDALGDDDDPYQILVKFPGYLDSAIQEVSDDDELLFQLELVP